MSLLTVTAILVDARGGPLPSWAHLYPESLGFSNQRESISLISFVSFLQKPILSHFVTSCQASVFEEGRISKKSAWGMSSPEQYPFQLPVLGQENLVCL